MPRTFTVSDSIVVRVPPAEVFRHATETWTGDRRRRPDFAAHAFDRITTRGRTFADFQSGNIAATPRDLKKSMESAAGTA